jgi:hypothetical protein
MKYAALVVQVVLQAFTEPFYFALSEPFCFILSIHGCLLSWSFVCIGGTWAAIIIQASPPQWGGGTAKP